MISGQRFFTHCSTRLVLLAAVIGFLPSLAGAQTAALDELPDAPQATSPQSAPSPPPPPPPAQTQPPSSSSSAQPAQAPAETKEQQRERAQRELEAEEHQRMLGVVPLFNVTSNANAAPLSPKQKYQLFFKGSTDWYVFAITAIDGEISLLGQEYPSYGEGAEGFAKYWGAAYADTFDGNFWGNAVLPSLWHEDPRYYRMGHGSFIRRVSYSAVTTVWCKRDKGTWGPNYANVAGNFIGGAISNIYYPSDQRGVGLTLGRGASVTYEGIVGAEIAEFWPDIAQHFMKKRQEKRARQAAQQPATQPATRMQPEGDTTPQPQPKPQ